MSAFGLVSTHSSVTTVNFIALEQDELQSIIGKLVYFDTEIQGDTYRAVGTVSNIITENSLSGNAYDSVISQGVSVPGASKDIRKSTFTIQAVFLRQNGDTEWSQHGAALPTSPSTAAHVSILTEEVLNEMTQGTEFPSVGSFRGMDAPLPINTPDFGGKRGSYHSGFLGRSGSGKSASAGFVLGTYMRHEQHAILVIDPQGQWSNENGFVFSPQQFAKSLGREVTVVRIGEDIRVPMDVNILSQLMDRTKAWTRFRRMGGDNQAIFSREVAERVARENLSDDPRTALSRVFSSIANSESALRRIYADPKTRDPFADELRALVGEELLNEEGEAIPYDAETLKDVEDNWESILLSFKPLLNLFSKENLAGKQRRPLNGPTGLLTNIFQVRDAHSAPAPYVVIDMSPDVANAAKAALDKNNDFFAMQKLLDDEDVKALLLQVILAEMKRASEIAFSQGGGNLNTQILFDEAWRFAPEGKASDAVMELASQLEGFALDTRKFGIGWTYILQSPGDLRNGIWRQLSYVYAGYGLVGEDVRRLETLTDDVAQINLYRQFISPASTGVYPFMILGSISPLIFTTSPTFTNIYTSGAEFLEANRNWIDRITKSRHLPNVTGRAIDPNITLKESKKPARREPGETRSYQVGKTYETSEPQIKPVKDNNVTKSRVVNDADLIDDTPF